jgi:uncharacterized protein with HEPN domain
MYKNRVCELFLFDIFVAILKIEEVTKDIKNGDELLHEFIKFDSVIREFEIIGEATKNLINCNLLDSKYRIIVDFRNKITHHYFGIDSDALWNVIQENLPLFRSDIKDKILKIDIILKNKLLDFTLEEIKIYKQIYEKFTNELL